jgi:hypothetical protein
MKFRAYLCLTLLFFLLQGKGVLMCQAWKLYESGAFAKPGNNGIVFAPQSEEATSSLSWSLQDGDAVVALNGQLVWTDRDGKETVPLLQQKIINLQDTLIQAVFSFKDLSIEFTIQVKPTTRGILMTVASDEPLPAVLRNEIALRLSLNPAAFLERTFIADQIAGIFPLYLSPEYSVWPDGRQWLIPLAGGRSFSFIGKKYTWGIKALAGGLSLEDRRESWSEGFFNLYTLLPIGKTGKLAEWEIEVGESHSEKMTDDIIFVQTGYHASQVKQAILPDLEQRQVYAKLLKWKSTGEFSPVLTGPVITINKGGKQQLRFDFSPVREEGLYVIQYGERYSRPIIISKWVYEQIGQDALVEWQAIGEEQYQEQSTLDWKEIELAFDTYIEVLSSAYPEMPTKDQNAFRRLAARWSKEHHQQGDSLSLIPPTEINYEMLLSNALNCWFLHQVFPEVVSMELVFSTLDYIHGLQENGGRSLVAGVGQRSCYLDDHLSLPESGSFWQVASLSNQEGFNSDSSLLTRRYLQLVYVARHWLGEKGKG